MKQISTQKFSLALVFLFLRSVLLAQDLPSPAPNLKTLASGSYVIAMDNANQTGNNGLFNLKAYGLVVYLLNNNVKVKWVIKSGKAKDGIDFSVAAAKIKPAAAATAAYDFRSGPFVIAAADTTGAGALIDAYNSSFSNTNDKIKVYKTTASTTVDERYNLTGFRPRALLLNNGGNFKIHRAALLNGGINFGMNSDQTTATNWSTGVAADLATGCYTFASEAHWDEKTPAKAQPVIDYVRAFLQAGGNVLAQCAAVRTYENTGLFLSTGGVDKNLENKFSGSLSTLVYPNADLSFSQIQGPLQIDKGGSLQNWQYAGTTRNNEHDHAKGGAQTGAAAGKFRASGFGGMLFYLGNHNFDKTDKLEVLNGIRMYLNALLTPPQNMAPVCTSSPTPPALCNLGYKVWVDMNHNNTLEDYEPGAPNLLVRLYLDANGDNQPDAEAAVDSIYTSPTGVFGFTNLADGKYIVGIVIDTLRYAISNLSPTTGLFPDNNVLRDNNGVYLADRIEVRTMPITLKAGAMPINDGDGANGNLTLNIALFEKAAGALPLTLVNFNGSSDGRKAVLNWEAKNELGVQQYVVEKSSDGIHFSDAGHVAARNSSSAQAYTLTDVNTTGAQVVYYRLRSVSSDARVQYSNIVSIRFDGVANTLRVYPNPASSYLVLSLQAAEATHGTARLLNASGQVVLSQPVTVQKGSNAVTLNNFGNLKSGIYHVAVVLATGQTVGQAILLNR